MSEIQVVKPVVIITGASRGIGFAAVKKFVKNADVKNNREKTYSSQRENYFYIIVAFMFNRKRVPFYEDTIHGQKKQRGYAHS